MRTVSIRLCDMERTCIPIGFVGENLYTRVRIDSKVVFDEYPTAIASLTVQDPNGSMYPGFISRDGDVIIWDVTASDLVYGGNGALQLAFFVDDVIAKSYICRTYVSKAMIGPGTIPTPIASWIDAANVVLGEAEEVFEALDNMTVAAETLAAGSTATAEISDVDGHKHIEFGIPKGDQGEQGEKGDTGAAGRDGTDGADGFSPTLVVTTITGGHRITITDKVGTQTVDVLDGEKGETGATGNGIASVVLNQDYTLTINYTNGQSMTTTSIRGEKGETGATGQTGATGATPIISIGTVTTGAPGSEASATMDTTDPAHPVLSMSIPEGEPGDATIDDTSTAADRVWSAQKVNELKSAITRPEFIVGNAEEVLSDRGETDEAVYLFRKTGGNKKAYNREKVKKIVGGTVSWNQRVKILTNSASKTENNVTFTDNRDGSYSVSTTAGGASNNTNFTLGNADTPNGHIILLMGIPSGASSSTYMLQEGWSGTRYYADTIFRQGTSNINPILRVANGAIITTAVVFKPQFIDLTAAIGSTIADHLYTIETQTAGSGVALFRSLFDKSYYAYNAGSLESVNVSEHRVVGFNQFNLKQFADDYPDYCTIVNGELNVTANSVLYTTGCVVNIPFELSNGGYYSFEAKVGTAYNVRLRFVFADGTYIDKGGVASTSWTKYEGSITEEKRVVAIRVNWSTSGTFSIRNLCINLSDSSRNGQYEPYQLYTYAMPNVTLRGIPKLVNNEIVFDGDELTPDGTVKRRYALVDLSTLAWSYSSGESAWYNTTLKQTGKFAYNNVTWISDKWNAHVWTGRTEGDIVCDGSSNVYCKTTDTVNSPTGYLVYELATPTTETVDGYQELQICNRYGTEEYIDRLATAETSPRDVAIPCGHETFYPVNVFDYIDELTKPDADFIADANIASGKYFSVGNGLYLSTQAIAQGETIIPGTNCTAVSLADALNAINQ